MSQLLLRLEEQLLTERDTYRCAELRAKRAAYWARIGRFPETRAEIADIRQVFGDGRSGRVTAFVMLAEALVEYYEKLTIMAADRVARARFLGQAMKDREVIALASAWLSYFDFERSKFDLAIANVRQAGEYASPDNHAAWTRCAIVLLNCFALCGDATSSQHWFQKGREHALKEGDQASIEALLHSKAVFGVAWLRAQWARDDVDSAAIARSRLEVSSARNLQKLARIAAHESYIDLADARLLILEGKFAEALEALEMISDGGPFPAGHFNDELLGLDKAFCLVSLGKADGAFEVFELSKATPSAHTDVDDRLVAAWMSYKLAIADTRFGSAEAAAAELNTATAEHDSTTQLLRDLLQPFMKS